MDFPRESEREQERKRRRSKRCDSPLSTLQMPLATEWSRLVSAACMTVCMFVLPWSASGLGGGLGFGRPAPVYLRIVAPVPRTKANVDASRCTRRCAKKPPAPSHLKDSGLKPSRAVPNGSSDHPDGGVEAVVRKRIYCLQKKSAYSCLLVMMQNIGGRCFQRCVARSNFFRRDLSEPRMPPSVPGEGITCLSAQANK